MKFDKNYDYRDNLKKRSRQDLQLIYEPGKNAS